VIAEIPPFKMLYQNWKGEIAERSVQPLGLEYGSTEWHPEPQWLLRALDTEKGAERQFAMKDIIRFGETGAASSGLGALVLKLSKFEAVLRDIHQRAVNYQIQYPLEGLQPLHALCAEIMQQSDWALGNEPSIP
jgi:predicted DNA-binding transcriptional regulator YafY